MWLDAAGMLLGEQPLYPAMGGGFCCVLCPLKALLLQCNQFNCLGKLFVQVLLFRMLKGSWHHTPSMECMSISELSLPVLCSTTRFLSLLCCGLCCVDGEPSDSGCWLLALGQPEVSVPRKSYGCGVDSEALHYLECTSALVLCIYLQESYLVFVQRRRKQETLFQPSMVERFRK